MKYLIFLLIIFPFLLVRDFPLLWLRYLLALAIFIYLLFQAWKKYDPKKLGFFKPTRQDFFFLIPVFPIIFLSWLLRARLSALCPPEPLAIPASLPAWLYLSVYALVSAPAQELIYRSFLINFLSEMTKNKKLVFLWSTLLFSFLHLAWQTFYLLGSLLLGAYFVAWFLKTKNVLLITLAHILIGLLFSSICFI